MACPIEEAEIRMRVQLGIGDNAFGAQYLWGFVNTTFHGPCGAVSTVGINWHVVGKPFVEVLPGHLRIVETHDQSYVASSDQ